MNHKFPLFKVAGKSLKAEAGFSEIIDSLQDKIKDLSESDTAKAIKQLPKDIYEKLFGDDEGEAEGGDKKPPAPKTKKYYQAVLSQSEKKTPGGKPITVTKLQTVPGPPGSDDSFYARVLSGIGAPVTPETKKFMYAWRKAEGGTASFNPFNTTKSISGETLTNYNSHGVKNYPSEDHGVAATIATLLNGKYSSIIEALKDPAPGAAMRAAQALAKTPWGTGRGVINVLRGKQVTRMPIYWLPEADDRVA